MERRYWKLTLDTTIDYRPFLEATKHPYLAWKKATHLPINLSPAHKKTFKFVLCDNHEETHCKARIQCPSGIRTDE